MSSSASVTPFSIVFIIGIFVGLLLSVYPLPPAMSPFRPEWICLFTIYWVWHTPQYVGVGIAWAVGLLQDVVEGAVWGGHAFALAMLAYICLMSYRRLRSYALSQQIFWVFVFVGLHQMFVNWFQGFEGYSVVASHMILSALITAACWPLLVICMQSLQRRYRIY